jgi:hypothetical protein
MKTKLRIAFEISYNIEGNYEYILNYIYENKYRLIDKVPTKIFFLGLLNRFNYKTLEEANRLLKLIKEVVVECLEISGIELSFVDIEWSNLQIVYNRYNRIDISDIENKPYLMNFYEF